MRAITYHGARDLRLTEKPDPKVERPTDAVIKVDATGICGSDLHIYQGRIGIEDGFTIGHEYVGTVLDTGDAVQSVAVGDKVLGTYNTACNACWHCRRGEYHKCDNGQTFGHGATLGNLDGTQAEQALVPTAELTLRKLPDGMADEIALFAGDVAGTAYNAICGDGVNHPPMEAGSTVLVLGLGPVGLMAAQMARVAGASLVIAVDNIAKRLEMAEQFGAVAVNFDEQDPRGVVKELTGGRGVDLAVDAVGAPPVFDACCRNTRKCGTVSVTGVYAERGEVHLGIMWIRALALRAGHANVIGHLDRVLELLESGQLDPGPLVTHTMALEDFQQAYDLYEAHESLKIVLRP